MKVLEPVEELAKRIQKTYRTNFSGTTDFDRRTRAQAILNDVIIDFGIDVTTLCHVAGKFEKSKLVFAIFN